MDITTQQQILQYLNRFDMQNPGGAQVSIADLNALAEDKLMKIYITGNAGKTLAKEIERQLNAYSYNAHADECGDDKSSFNAVKDNLRGYTDAILLIDLLESCEQSTFAFKVAL